VATATSFAGLRIPPAELARLAQPAPGSDLNLSTEEIAALPAGYEAQFSWALVGVQKRPTVVLIHRIVGTRGDVTGVAEGHFYASQGFNALQILIGLFPVMDGTAVIYTNRTNTDQVATFGRSRPRGRRLTPPADCVSSASDLLIGRYPFNWWLFRLVGYQEAARRLLRRRNHIRGGRSAAGSKPRPHAVGGGGAGGSTMSMTWAKEAGVSELVSAVNVIVVVLSSLLPG
jgi:hypothetical protein